MAATTEKTVEYVFGTRITNLVTGTTLAASTRLDFTAITLTLPETTSRAFKSVMVEVHWRDGYTVVYGVVGWRIGVKLGAVAFTDVDYLPTAQANTGDHEASTLLHDATAYFTSNFGTGTTQTCQIGFACATATAANVQNITAKLIITYEYDESAESTLVKTVRIPIQSHHTLLSGAAVEIGTVTGTNNAPANQIPNLDTFLPETSKVYKEVWFEFFSNDASTATTDINTVYQIDDGATAARNPCECALTCGTYYYDIWLTKYIDSAAAEQNPYSISTNAAHAFKAYSSTATRFDAFGGMMCVTYTYAKSSTTVMNSIILPLDTNTGYVNSTAVADGNFMDRILHVEEPTTITLAQSGVLLHLQSPGGGTFRILAGSQAERSYTLTALVNSGGHTLMHRIDHNSGFTLARGKNTLQLKIYTTAAAVVNSVNGIAIINYTSGVATGGEKNHNHTTRWFLASQVTTGAVAQMNEIATTNQKTPNIISPTYFLNGVGYELIARFGIAVDGISLHAEKLASEYNADGWRNIDNFVHANDGELCSTCYYMAGLDHFNQNTNITGQMNIETARKYRVHFSTAALFALRSFITYHSIGFTVAGTVSGYSGTGVGLTVDIYDSTTKEIVATATTTSGGAYTATIFDSVHTFYAVVREDATHVGRSDNGAPS